jgi:hypothetical protein|eukprot:COSAG01_NODE_215_length_21709_cov_141.101217_27_plen_50_part_00
MRIGVVHRCRRRKPGVSIVLADPIGSVFEPCEWRGMAARAQLLAAGGAG